MTCGKLSDKISSMDSVSYPAFCEKLSKGKPSWYRMGQYAFNELARVKPRLADNIVQMSADGNRFIDPFYNDANLNKFHEYIWEHWDDNS